MRAVADTIHRLLLCALLTWAQAAWAQAGGDSPRRVALVIGNSAYATRALLNPVNDARAMAASLLSAGFTVILKTDATQPVLTAAVFSSSSRIKRLRFAAR